MKRLIGLMLALLIVASPIGVFAATALPAIHSETYLVMNAATGQVLLERGSHNRMYPASITKIITSALALEKAAGSLDTQHTMTYEAAHSIDAGSTHVALTEEEVVTVRDLLNATMIESANDAANGLAEYVAGSLGAFPPLMNALAAELGMVDSHFTNANGLHNAEHYTSAYDMALATRWALGVGGFRELFGAVEYTIPATNKQSVARKFGTHHHMLVNSQYYYEGTTGGKLGWTPEARHTLVTLAERDGLELICVVMRSQAQFEKYEDAAALLDACFADYSAAVLPVAPFCPTPIPVYRGETQIGEVEITSEELSLSKPATLAKADIKGTLLAPERYVEGEEIAPRIRFTDRERNLLAELPVTWEYRAVEPPAAPTYLPKVTFSPVEWIVLASPLELALLALGLVMAVLFLIRENNLRKRRRRRREKEAKLAALIDVAPELRRRTERLQVGSGGRERPNPTQRRNTRHPRGRG